jgi:imidazolonepropionase-like amidohydrolase
MEGMQSIFSGSPTVIAADSEREIGRALMFAREFGMKAIVAGGSDSFRMKERLKAANIPVVVRIDLTDPPRAEAGVPAPILVERKLNWENRAGNLSALALEGVPFGLSTMGAPVGDFLTNARKLIGRGLASDSVLAGLTTQAAKILGLENQLGTLEPGKTANLVLFDGPFEDAKSTVKMIFVQGKKQEPAK